MNVSRGGICLECAKELVAGQVWRLEIKLFDKEPAVRRTKVVWRKQVEPSFFIAGCQFLD